MASTFGGDWKKSLIKIYPSDGLDMLNATYNGVSLRSEEVGQYYRLRLGRYILSPSTIFTSFLGLPNRLRRDEESLGASIAKNFFGWPEADVTGIKRGMAYVLMPSTFLINLITTPIKFALNIAKVGTEFVPRLLSTFCRSAIEGLTRYKEPGDILSSVAVGLLKLVLATTTLIHFVGQAITSPIRGVRSGRIFAKQLAEDFFGKDETDKSISILERVAGVGLSILSAGISAVAYVIAFPMGLKFLAATVLPVVANQLPAVVSNFVTNMVAMVSPYLATPVGDFMGYLLNPVFNSLGMSVSPALSGLTSLVGATVAVVGSLTEVIGKKLANWLHKPSKPVTHLEQHETLLPAKEKALVAGGSTKNLKQAMPTVKNDLNVDFAATKKPAVPVIQPDIVQKEAPAAAPAFSPSKMGVM